ncbi:glycoside hydrolase family 31 protein (plasmid) [Entomospira entomophila]|uniref:Alpha-glucosidase n=1 Tax=Entomospira entomophila TaxID=2719988 RepID=A0A968GBS8_9SPIO|nr:TIM-barrel domain-containing protein [Entomospira entomophilus]NIZ41470.1 hypothetical protein [Entomospira entomophilus]WDI36304.1 glycoside hydrolase family 31 protein [Entomospira entomophilus]
MKIELNEDGFRIFLGNGEILLSHTQAQPCLKIGSGINLKNSDESDAELDYKEQLSLQFFIIYQESDRLWRITLSHTQELKEVVNLTYRSDQPTRIEIDSTYPEGYFDRMWLRLYSRGSEHFYGGGQHGYQLDLKGYTHMLFIQDELFQKEARTLPLRLVRQPSYISSRHYGFIAPDAQGMIFNAIYDDHIDVELWGNIRHLVIISASTMLELLHQQSDDIGRPKQIPQWISQGLFTGLCGPTDRMKETFDHLKEHALTNINGIWMQDWARLAYPTFGESFCWNWMPTDSLLKGTAEKIERLQRQQVMIIAYMNGFLTEGTLPFNEADSLDYLVTHPNKETFLYHWQEFSLGIIDLTNPDAYHWFIQQMRQYFQKIDVRAWVIDDGSHLPLETILHHGIASKEHQHRWSLLLADAMNDAMHLLPHRNEVALLSTTGWLTMSAKVHAIVLARQYVEVGGNKAWTLKPTLFALLSGSASGYGLQATIIGHCFGAPAPAELLIRWAELSLFTAFFWLQDADSHYQTFRYYEDMKILLHLRRLARLFESLHFYRSELIQEYVSDGTPITAPLFVYFEHDVLTYAIEDQMMFGRDILVAPILQSGITRRTVYFPEGRWHHFSSPLVVEGPIWQEVTTRLGDPLAFYVEHGEHAIQMRELALEFQDVPPYFH